MRLAGSGTFFRLRRQPWASTWRRICNTPEAEANSRVSLEQHSSIDLEHIIPIIIEFGHETAVEPWIYEANPSVRLIVEWGLKQDSLFAIRTVLCRANKESSVLEKGTPF
jgi:hypothetical protein